MKRVAIIASFVGVLVASWPLAGIAAEKKYGPGVTDTEIKLGQTEPYSGPVTALSMFAKAQVAYIDKINAEGGINGRKIKLMSLDDAYSPPRTVEQTRRLVEQDGVLAIFGTMGTATNLAVRKYLNDHKVPQLFALTGSSTAINPAKFPWTMPWLAEVRAEARVWATHVLQTRPNAKIALLTQNDDFGKDAIRGIEEGLGAKAKTMIVARQTYEVTDPTLDTQIIALKGSGADTLFDGATPRYLSQAIRKAYDIGWHPEHYVLSGNSSVEIVLRPAGLEKSKGLIATNYLKDPSDPALKNDPGVVAFLKWQKTYMPKGNPNDSMVVAGYSQAQTLEHVLKMCGDNLTRENLMKQAESMKDFQLPMLQPGVTFTTSPTDYRLVKAFMLLRFDGTRWLPLSKQLIKAH
jgi:branched-chain amino acid transport system substrate-binding protein